MRRHSAKRRPVAVISIHTGGVAQSAGRAQCFMFSQAHSKHIHANIYRCLLAKY